MIKLLKEEKLNYVTLLIMLFLGILFYFIPGEWISIEKDSVAYLNELGREGVLPGYPAFLSFLRFIFKEEYFLDSVVSVQSTLAIVCTMIFVIVLQKQFRLFCWECIFLYAVCMLPFSIYLPRCGITHQIMTEGITYAVFYLFFTAVLQAVWNAKLRWYFASQGFAVLLGLIRSQMIFLQIACVLLFVWIIWRKSKKGAGKKFAGIFAATAVGLFLAIASYKIIYGIVAYDMQIQAEKMQPANEEINESVNQGQRQATSQFDSLIISRGFFEADKEDEMLFEDEIMKEIFNRAFQRIDEGQHRYVYAKPGLYMWEDLVYDKMAIEIQLAIMDYDKEFPGKRTREAADIMREMGVRLLVEHFGRYTYHAIRLMLPSFIASVFFQIRPIYLLCHFIALFIYLFSFSSCYYAVKTGKNRQVIELMSAVLIFLIIMVVSINLVFIGLQRYVVYGMGIFYCSLYLLLKENFLPIYRKMRGDRSK